MLHISIDTIPHSEQETGGYGNYKGHMGRSFIEVSEMGDSRYERLVAIHEIVEQTLQLSLGISEEKITEWDLAHSTSDDPGSVPGCPYQGIHLLAEKIEKLVCEASGLSWEAYCKSFDYIKE